MNAPPAGSETNQRAIRKFVDQMLGLFVLLHAEIRRAEQSVLLKLAKGRSVDRLKTYTEFLLDAGIAEAIAHLPTKQCTHVAFDSLPILDVGDFVLRFEEPLGISRMSCAGIWVLHVSVPGGFYLARPNIVGPAVLN